MIHSVTNEQENIMSLKTYCLTDQVHYICIIHINLFTGVCVKAYYVSMQTYFHFTLCKELRKQVGLSLG